MVAEEPAPVGASTLQRPNEPTLPFNHPQGKSTPMEYPNQHQRAQHEMYQQQTTPLSHKSKRNHHRRHSFLAISEKK